MLRSIPSIIAIATITAWSAPNLSAATTESHAIEVDGLAREYQLQVPDNVRADRPLEVVFVLHGGAGRAKQFAEYLNFDQYIDARNLLVVYPQGFERHWNDGRPDVSYETHDRNVDDVAFLRAVVAEILRRFPVDRHRIYVAGISNGGMMSLRLACEAADLFAAVAVLTASFPVAMADRCDPMRPVPILFINGTEDPIFPYGGGAISIGRREYGQVRSTPQTIRQWAALDECAPPPRVVPLPDTDAGDGSRVVVEHYSNCREGSEVTLYRVEGGGHSWPGRPQYLPRFIIGRTNMDIDATRHILDFFERHTMGRY
jgi:polyhydroxybutyrate depolymerase